MLQLWDFDTNDEVFQPILFAMRTLLKAEIDRSFFSKTALLGQKVTYEDLESSTYEWSHLYLEIPSNYVTTTVSAAQEERRAMKQVFRRSLEEISEDD